MENPRLINRIIFKDGILKPMLELSDIPELNINIDELKLKIKFSIVKKEDDILCDFEHGKMLANNINQKHEYCMDISFDHQIDIDMLNTVIHRTYKIIQFINFDYNSPIKEIELDTNVGVLNYVMQGVNYSNGPIRRFNFIANCTEILNNLIGILVQDDSICNIEFLELLDNKRFIVNDYWKFAQSLETNVSETISNNPTYNKIKEENIELIDKIKSLAEFIALDNDRKNFILSMIDNPKFRDKLEVVLERYVNFACEYRSNFPLYTPDDIVEFGKQISYARNCIHGTNSRLNQETADLGLRLSIIGLIIYILDNAQASASCKFNMFRGIF